MKVAALYDVHGNLPALEAVLADPRCAAAETIVCGGDLVVGPYPAECLDLLEDSSLRVRFVMGNCDREAVELPEGGELDAAEVAATDEAQARALDPEPASGAEEGEPVVADALVER